MDLGACEKDREDRQTWVKCKELSSMHTVAVISVGVAWLLSLVTLGLGLTGAKRWQGRGSRLRSAGGLVMFTGLLIDLLLHWPAHPLLVDTLGLLLVAGGAACVFTSVFVAAAKPRTAVGSRDTNSGPTGL